MAAFTPFAQCGVVELMKNEGTEKQEVVPMAPISKDRLSELVESLPAKNGDGE